MQPILFNPVGGGAISFAAESDKFQLVRQLLLRDTCVRLSRISKKDVLVSRHLSIDHEIYCGELPKYIDGTHA